MLNTKRIQTETEELLGLRNPKSPNRAVRFKDLEGFVGGVNEGLVRSIAEKVAEDIAREVAEGYDGANVDLDQLRSDLDQAQQDANQAATDAQNALLAANAAQQYADNLVDQAKQDMAVDFAAAQQAAFDALESSGIAASAALNAQTSADAAEATRLIVDAAVGLAEGYAGDAEGHNAAADSARQLAQAARAAADAAANLASSRADDAGANALAAAGSADIAQTHSDDASESADVARAYSLRAQVGAARLFPQEFTGDAMFWCRTGNGRDDRDTPLHTQPNAAVEYGPDYVERGPGGTAHLNIYPRAAAPFMPGRRYRFTIRYMFLGGVPENVPQLGRHFLTDTLENDTSPTALISNGFGATALPDTLITEEFQWTPTERPESTRFWRPFLRLRAGSTYGVRAYGFLIEDVTESLNSAAAAAASIAASETASAYKDDAGASAAFAETQRELAAQAASDAGDSASAANTAVSHAAAYADDASQSASAANMHRLEAETASGQAAMFRNEAVTAKEDAEGASSAAAISEGIATEAANDAGDSASASAMSASIAESHASDSGTSAAAAAASVIEAETAKSQAESYRNEAVTAMENAESAASAASMSEGLTATAMRGVQAALNASRTLFPTIPTEAAAAFGTTFAGTVEGYSALLPAGAYREDPTDGPFARQNFAASTRSTLVRGLAASEEDAVYRVTARFKLSVEATVRFGVGWVYANGTLRASGQYRPATYSPGEIHTISMIFGRVGAGVGGLADTNGGALATWQEAAGIRFGLQTTTTTAEPGVTTADTFDVFEIRVEDLTEADKAARSASEASGFAEAAYDHTVTAFGYVDDAKAEAGAAEESRLKAEAALDDALDAKSEAGIARDAAVTAQQNAETASASASDSLKLTAEVAGRGGSCLSDTLLVSSDWSRFGVQGVMTLQDNWLYPVGRSWRFQVTATQNDAIGISQSPATIWPGQTNAEAYVIEIEFNLSSGSLGGAGVQLGWTNTDGSNYWAWLRLSDMQASTGSPGRARIARGIIKRPTGFTGTFASHTFRVWANTDSNGWTRAAKTIVFHRINIRPASEEELGRGEVMANVEAHLSVNYFTRAQTNSAIANFDMSLNTSLNGMRSSVEQSATALTNLSGSVARFRNIVTVNGEQRAGIEAVAFDGNGMGTGSVVKLVGDDVVAEGTLSARTAVIHDGSGNMVPDPQFLHKSLAGWTYFGVANQITPISKENIPGSVVQSNAPARTCLLLSNHVGTGNITLRGTPFDVKPGEIFNLAFDYAVSSGLFHDIRFRLRFYDSDGGSTITRGLMVTSAPASWQRYSGDYTVPDGVVQAVIEIMSISAGIETWSCATNFSCIRKRSGATLITPFSVTTDLVSAETVRAWNGRFADLAAANVRIGNAEIKRAHIDDLAVNRAKIDDLAVNSLKIADRSVSSWDWALTAGNIATPAGDSWTTIQTLVMQKGRSEPLPIFFRAGWNTDEYTQGIAAQLALFRNGSQIFQTELPVWQSSAGLSRPVMRNQTLTHIDTWTGATSVTYELRGRLRGYTIRSGSEYGDINLFWASGNFNNRFLGAFNAIK